METLLVFLKKLNCSFYCNGIHTYLIQKQLRYMFIKLLHVKEHRAQHKFISPGYTPNQREETEFEYDVLCILHCSVN